MLTVYIDRLRNGHEVLLEEKEAPTFLDIDNDPEIRPSGDVSFSGKAYLAGDWLVIQGSISTQLTMVCAMCNDPFQFPIHIDEWIHEEAIENIKGGIFSYADLVREAILLEVPYIGMCGGTECLRIDEVKKYLVRPTAEDTDADGEVTKKKMSKAPKKSSTKSELTSEEYEKELRENGHQPFKDFPW